MSKVPKANTSSSRRASTSRSLRTSRRSPPRSTSSTGSSPTTGTSSTVIIRYRTATGDYMRSSSATRRYVTIRATRLRPFSVQVLGRNLRINNVTNERRSTDSITSGMDRLRCSSSNGSAEGKNFSAIKTKNYAYRIHEDINANMNMIAMADDPEAEELESTLRRARILIERMKLRRGIQKGDYVANAMRRLTSINYGGMEEEPQTGRRSRRDSSSSDDSVFVSNTPGDDDVDNDNSGEKISFNKDAAPPTNYHGFYERVTQPQMMRRNEEIKKKSGGSDYDAYLRSIFYSEATDEEGNSADREPVQDIPEDLPNTETKDLDSSVEVVYKGTNDEVVTISDSESEVEVLGEPEEPDAPEDRGEPEKSKVDTENYVTEDEISLSSEDEDVVDMLKEEEKEAKEIKTIEELHVRVTMMSQNLEEYTLEDARRMKLRLMDFVEEDRAMTEMELDIYQMLVFMVDRISISSVHYLAIGDGLNQVNETASSSSDDDNVVSEDFAEEVDMAKEDQSSDNDDTVDMEEDLKKDKKA